MRIQLVILAILNAIINITYCYADDSRDMQKVKEFCDENPLDARCEKYLDGEYRRYKDLEKETKDVREERYQEQKYKRERSTELLTFCRKSPDSERCAVLHKKR